MGPDAATGLSNLSPYETLQFLNTLGWSLALGLSLLIWAMLEKVDREDRQRKGSSSPEATRERLFGRAVVEGEPDQAEAPEPEASGDRKCHAGCPCGNGWTEGDD